jgi:DNA-binding IclR family transcriptional regulator
MASTQEATESRQQTVRAVNRAGTIVTALAAQPYPMSVRQLARIVKLSPASTHRLLLTLVQMGWVDQNEHTGRYRLGTRLLGIGSMGLITNPVVQNGKSFLVRLATLTGLDAVLSTLVGARVVHLARVQGAHGRSDEFEPGVSQPAHAMADGKVLLAYTPTEERMQLYEAGLRSYTARTIVDPDELEKQLAEVRQRGYAIAYGERFERVAEVAVPILGSDGMPLLAMLSIGRMELDEEHLESMAQDMLSLANETSEQLILIGDMPKPSNEFARYNLE